MNIESRLASFHAFEKGKQNKIDSVREAILSDAGQEWVRVEVEDLNDRWNEIFSPTLKGAGYVESDQVGADWEKRYQPQKDR